MLQARSHPSFLNKHVPKHIGPKKEPVSHQYPQLLGSKKPPVDYHLTLGTPILSKFEGHLITLVLHSVIAPGLRGKTTIKQTAQIKVRESSGNIVIAIFTT